MQTDYIYHVPNGWFPHEIFLFAIHQLIHFTNISVDSNDRLYLGDDEFRTEAVDYCSQLLVELLNDINQLGNENQYRKQV